MRSFTYTICAGGGLHVRIAASLAKLASDWPCKIQIERDGHLANAKKLMEIVLLRGQMGDRIKFTFEGECEEEACCVMQDFCEKNL